jgi:hypothetical protein
MVAALQIHDSNSGRTPAFSRRITLELFEATRPSDIERAQGMPGAGRNPWPACNKKARGRTTGSADIRHSLRDGFNAYT